MAKGLTRSLSRGDKGKQKVVRENFVINHSLDITGAAGSADDGTFVIGDFPAGNILILGVVANIGADATGDTHVIDNWNGDFAIGTAPNADATLSGSEVDIVPAAAFDAGASDKIAPSVRAVSTATEQVIINNLDGSLEINFNMLTDDGVITDTETGTFSITGTLDIVYTCISAN